MTKLLTFKTYPNVASAEYDKEVLVKNNINAIVEGYLHTIDSVITGKGYENNIVLKISGEDFQRAKEILLKEIDIKIEDVDENYYLLSFSDDELLEILIKSDEWGDYDYKLAKEILDSRGVNYNYDELEELKSLHLSEKAEPHKKQMLWIFLGYLFSLCGGFAGILLGWMIWRQKKVLSNGKEIHSFSSKDRRHGKIIFVIGVTMLSLIILFKITGLYHFLKK